MKSPTTKERKMLNKYNYEEILKWYLGFKNSDFKHISVTEFFNYVSQKLREQKFERSKRNLAASKQNSGGP